MASIPQSSTLARSGSARAVRHRRQATCSPTAGVVVALIGLGTALRGFPVSAETPSPVVLLPVETIPASPTYATPAYATAAPVRLAMPEDFAPPRRRVDRNSLPWQPAGDEHWRPPVITRDWKYIVLHHTASEVGSVKGIDAVHKQRRDSRGRPWLGIGYHFVIGNGKGMQDGAVEPTFRWMDQLHGAHAGSNEYNGRGIGVCLVGNFQHDPPTPAQLKSLEQLLVWLTSQYDIKRDDIIGHGDVKATACPGHHFPLDDVLKTLAIVPPLEIRSPVALGNPFPVVATNPRRMQNP